MAAMDGGMIVDEVAPASALAGAPDGQVPERQIGGRPGHATVIDASAFRKLAARRAEEASRDADVPDLVPNRRDAVFRRMLALADVVAAAAALGLIGALAPHRFTELELISIPMIVLAAKLMGRYDRDDMMLRRSTLEEVPPLLALAAVWALAWSLLAFPTGGAVRLPGGGTAVLWLVMSALLVISRTLARHLARLLTARERVLIIGSARARERLAHCLSTDPGARIDVVGFLPLEDERRTGDARDWQGRSRRKRSRSFNDLIRVVAEERVERVFLIPTTADSELMLEAVNATTALGVNVSIVPRLFEVVGSAVEFDTVGGVTVLGVRRTGLSRSSLLVKRAVDVLGAALGLLFLAPLFAAVALAIRLDSSGPVFFRQERVGREGRRFHMFKFRTMVDGAEAQRAALAARNETHGLFKLSDDPRVTRVGRWLRRTSVDELPQLINVLRGDMSLVGPRPLVVDEDRLVVGRHRDRRLQLAPGMTGPWQVLGPARPPLSEMVKTDFLYATHWSLWTDIKIVLRTFGHVLSRRGV
jgi:exopolysaccharide biosynthesis polyprenyl glycosylphosphotransferase